MKLLTSSFGGRGALDESQNPPINGNGRQLFLVDLSEKCQKIAEGHEQLALLAYNQGQRVHHLKVARYWYLKGEEFFSRLRGR